MFFWLAGLFLLLPTMSWAQLEKNYVDDHVRIFYSVQKPQFADLNSYLNERGLRSVDSISGWSLELFRQQDWTLFGDTTGDGKNFVNVSTRLNYRMRPWVPEGDLQVEARSMAVLFTVQAAHNISRFLRAGASFGVGPSWIEVTNSRHQGKVRMTAPKPEVSWVPAVAVNLRHGVAAPFLLLEVGYEFQRVESLNVNDHVDGIPDSLDFSGPYMAIGLGF